ncbi:unnamed protein product [Bathycoccus prasinos]
MSNGSREISKEKKEKEEEKTKKKTKKKKNKTTTTRKNRKLLEHLSLKATTTTPSKSSSHPFDVDASDHCETPFLAYKDIEPFLFRIALSLKKTKASLKIYDPYFCEGSAKEHLKRLGFESVHNVNEDFYENIKKNTIPEYDVLLTNPPYSSDHFKRILSFCGAREKPFFLLLPNFVCRKTYYANEITSRKKEPLAGKGTTPFITFWYLEFGDAIDKNEIRGWWLKKYSPHSRCELPAPKESLPQQQRLQKRSNPNKRRREKAQNKNILKEPREKKSGSIYYDPNVAQKKKRKKLESKERV